MGWIDKKKLDLVMSIFRQGGDKSKLLSGMSDTGFFSRKGIAMRDALRRGSIIEEPEDPISLKRLIIQRDDVAGNRLKEKKFMGVETVKEDVKDLKEIVDYKRDLIDHINSFVEEDGRWEYNERPNDFTEGEYHRAKVRLLRGLKLLNPKKYPIREDYPENTPPDIQAAATPKSYYITPYLTKSQERLSIMKDIHDKIDFSESELHNQLMPPPTSENLEGYMEILGKHDAGLRHYFDAGGDED